MGLVSACDPKACWQNHVLRAFQKSRKGGGNLIWLVTPAKPLNYALGQCCPIQDQRWQFSMNQRMLNPEPFCLARVHVKPIAPHPSFNNLLAFEGGGHSITELTHGLRYRTVYHQHTDISSPDNGWSHPGASCRCWTEANKVLNPVEAQTAGVKGQTSRSISLPTGSS